MGVTTLGGLGIVIFTLLGLVSLSTFKCLSLSAKSEEGSSVEKIGIKNITVFNFIL
jgi:hypothetical protein